MIAVGPLVAAGRLDRTHLYRASDEDAEWIWPGCSTESWAAELLERGVIAVLVTRGGDGVDVFTEEGSFSVPSLPVDVVDTVGAVAAAAVTCSRRGADPPTVAELAS